MNTWIVIYRMSWAVLIILGCIGASVFFVPKWKEYREYQRKHAEMSAQIELEEEMINLLRAKQERFRTDPRFVERVARDLGLARSNEVIFRFDSDPLSSAPAPLRP